MARFYSNENFPLPVVENLRALGHDVLTIQEMGKANQAIEDDEILNFAYREGRILLTLNRRHFIRLHKRKVPHAGIVACSYDPDFSGLAARIDKAVGSKESLAGKLIRINRSPR